MAQVVLFVPVVCPHCHKYGTKNEYKKLVRKKEI